MTWHCFAQTLSPLHLLQKSRPPLEAPGCVTWDRMEYRYFVITRGSTLPPRPAWANPFPQHFTAVSVVCFLRVV